MRTTEELHVDVLVIGAGQGGGPLAGAFARAGRRTVLVERKHVGGTCVNEGCSPTKTMIASARVAWLAGRAAEYGIRASVEGIDLRRVRDRKQAIVDRFREGSRAGLERSGVELVHGAARFVAPRTLEVRTADGTTRRLSADVVVINTGLRPLVPSIPGLGDVPYLTSTTIMELDDVPEHLVVLGGGYVGLEFAQMFRRFGSRVTVLDAGHQLLAREDADVADEITRLLREEGIDVRLGTSAAAVRGARGGIEVDVRPVAADGRPEAVQGSHLLVAVGRRPNTDDLQATAGRIALDARGYVAVNERLETSAPGVYAIGDVTGGPAFTHISYDDFRILRTNLLEHGNATTTGRLVPHTVFIDPQLGRIGMTEREAREAGREIRVARLPMAHVARALEVDESGGFMKAVVEARTGRILGAAVLGLEGGELATIFQVAMMGRLPYTALRDAVFSHPTLAESLNTLFTALDRESPPAAAASTAPAAAPARARA